MFEAAFVINLKIRPDRLEEFHREAAKITCLPEVQVWPAIHGDTCQPPRNWNAGAGAWGCLRSHQNILEHCLNNRIGSYIVFEDDAKIRDGFDEFLSKAMEEIPEDWEQLYLGGQLMHDSSHPPIRVTPHIHRPFNVNRTHCFAVSRAGMLPIYQHICELPFVEHDHIDHHLGRWHEDSRNKVYCLSRWMVGQHGSSSNVSGKNEAVQFYQDAEASSRSHWLYESPVCVLFRGSRSLVNECLPFLHFGNTIDSMGYDVTLAEAARYQYPGPKLSRWFGWICGEIAREESHRLPAVYHPQIGEEMLRKHIAKKVIVIKHFASAQEAAQQIKEQLPEWKYAA